MAEDITTFQFIDSKTGKLHSYIPTIKWYNGTDMDDTKADGIVYIKKPNGLYYKLANNGPIDLQRFGLVSTMDDSNGVNNREALSKAMTLSKTLGGLTLYVPAGNYILDVSIPIDVPSNTNLIGEPGLSVFHIDPTTIVDSTLRAWPLTTGAVFFGSDDGYQPQWVDGNATSNIYIKGISINCDYERESLATGFILKGIVVKCCNGVKIQHCTITNLPNTGISTPICHNVELTYNICTGCGFGNILTPSGRNGISTSGYDNILDFDTRNSIIITNNICNYNYEEGIQYGYTRGVLIAHNICLGNGDQGIEGDTAYQTTKTKVSESKEIPSSVIISSNYIDGMKEDGTFGQGGISFSGGNEGICKIQGNMVRRVSGKMGISATQNSGGAAFIEGNILDQVDPGANSHIISVGMEDVTVVNNKILNSGASNSHADIFVYLQAKYISISGNTSDGGSAYLISINPYTVGFENYIKTISIINNECKTTTGYGIVFRSTINQAIDSVIIKNNRLYGLNSSAATDKSAIIFNVTSSTALTIGNIEIDGNNTTYSGATLYPVRFTGFTAGSISKASIKNNDFSGCTFPTGYRSAPDATAINTLNYLDKNNQFPSQKVLTMDAIPTTGTWTKGDRIYPSVVANVNFEGWVCTANGTPGTWTPFGTNGTVDSGKLSFGTTANRPTVTSTGYQYFDTTLSKPIYWSGSAWIDSAGTEVS